MNDRIDSYQDRARLSHQLPMSYKTIGLIIFFVGIYSIRAMGQVVFHNTWCKLFGYTADIYGDMYNAEATCMRCGWFWLIKGDPNQWNKDRERRGEQ